MNFKEIHTCRIIVLSLMYGGPAPQFFAQSVAEYMTPYTVSVEDVPDYHIQQSLFIQQYCTPVPVFSYCCLKVDSHAEKEMAVKLIVQWQGASTIFYSFRPPPIYSQL